jgi:hypothetical protein
MNAKATIVSPDLAASDPDLISDTVPMMTRRHTSRAKRLQQDADTRDGTGTRPAAKVARLAISAEEGTTAQDGDETPKTPLTTEKMMDLLKDLWSDDECVIIRALKYITDVAFRDPGSEENESKMRLLGGHTAVFQVIQTHLDCVEIQEEGMRALELFSYFMPTKELLVDIGYMEVILARMERYPDSLVVQLRGCMHIGLLVNGMKVNAERLEKSGGIALVLAAMKAHPNIDILQQHGCCALFHMSEWEEYRPLIVEAGGASVIASIMEKNMADPLLHQLAYSSMERLAKKP